MIVTFTSMANDLRSHYNSCLFHSSSALHRRLERLAEEQFKQVELSPTQGFILITLKKAPGITTKDLALVHQLDPSTITRMLDKLEDKGLIQRENFGRITRVFATEKGRRKEADAKAAWKRLRFDYGQLIGVEEASHLADRITGSLSQLEKE
jgi:MarR family transcriptional regulator, organic hydroperoxide resistance regulator